MPDGREDVSHPVPLDLMHRGLERVIAAYLVETGEGPALFDCGPATCVPVLKQRLAERGLLLADMRHLLLSHIHLDHAGAAGVLVREHPGLRVHVSAIGAPHLVDPSRLERSARRLYGEAFEPLWGELAPVPEENVHVVGERVVGLECFPAPGHASHHVVYLADDGTALCGDAAGVRIAPSRLVLPPTPPPEVDLKAWDETLGELERRRPERLALIHFGVAADAARHIADLRDRLFRWGERVRRGDTESDFVAAGRAEIARAGDPDEYEQAMPLWQSHAGLKRYWERRGAAS